jgi:hypothetical protein
MGNRTKETPEREKMRLALIKQYRIAHAEKEVEKHFEEMMGKRDMAELISGFFDEGGNPPPNMSLKDIDKQYKTLAAQCKWLEVIFHELHEKIKETHPEGYEAEQKERAEKHSELEARRAEAYKAYLDNREDDGKREDLLKLVHSLIKDSRQIWELRQYSKFRDLEGFHIIGVRHVEEALRYMFVKYKNSHSHISTAPDTRYEKMREQADWIEITIAEIEPKLLTLREILDSSHAFQLHY